MCCEKETKVALDLVISLVESVALVSETLKYNFICCSVVFDPFTIVSPVIEIIVLSLSNVHVNTFDAVSFEFPVAF